MPYPSYETHDLVVMRRDSPDEYRRIIRSALRKGGSIPRAALSLGVSERTLRRWVMWDERLSEGITLRRAGRKRDE